MSFLRPWWDSNLGTKRANMLKILLKLVDTLLSSSSLACFNVQNVPDDGIVLGTELLVNPLDVLGGDLLDGGDNVVLGAEVDALLGLNHPPDHGAGDAQLVEHQGRLHHLMANSENWKSLCNDKKLASANLCSDV